MITYKKYASPKEAKFSIIIPTWNNLAYLQCCINSIKQNSTFKHQIVVHVNHGNDGTADWLKDQKISYTHSPENVGICYAMNAAYSLCTSDYIVYMNDDMYACPEWDKHLWDEITKIGHDQFYLSGTMIEHTETNNDCVAAPYDFGKDLETFDESKLLAEYKKIEFADWVGTTWPPNIMHRKLWDLVGGFSVELTPGLYSDPDFAMKVWHSGVRYFKGVGASKVYHFQSKSTGKVKRNNGRVQFLRKWGMSSSTFTKYFLRRGEAFRLLEDPNPNTDKKLSFALKKDSFKRVLKSLA